MPTVPRRPGLPVARCGVGEAARRASLEQRPSRCNHQGTKSGHGRALPCRFCSWAHGRRIARGGGAVEHEEAMLQHQPMFAAWPEREEAPANTAALAANRGHVSACSTTNRALAARSRTHAHARRATCSLSRPCPPKSRPHHHEHVDQASAWVWEVQLRFDEAAAIQVNEASKPNKTNQMTHAALCYVKRGRENTARPCALARHQVISGQGRSPSARPGSHHSPELPLRTTRQRAEQRTAKGCGRCLPYVT